MPESTRAGSNVRTDEPSAVIACVHESAGVQYRIAKRRKQADLAFKIADAQRAGDKNILKSEKKKVDNHASAVASRVKQEFLITSFEALVTNKMRDCTRLVAVVRRQMLEAAKKDQVIAELSDRVAQLTEEGEQLQQQLQQGNDQQTINEPGGWLSCPELAIFPSSLPTSFGELAAHTIPPLSEDAARVQESALSSVLEAVAPRMHDEFSKLEPTTWDVQHAAFIMERQASVRARLKKDEQDDILNPVA